MTGFATGTTLRPLSSSIDQVVYVWDFQSHVKSTIYVYLATLPAVCQLTKCAPRAGKPLVRGGAQHRSKLRVVLSVHRGMIPIGDPMDKRTMPASSCEGRRHPDRVYDASIRQLSYNDSRYWQYFEASSVPISRSGKYTVHSGADQLGRVAATIW